MLKHDNWMVGWTPDYHDHDTQAGRNQVAVGPWPDETGWSGKYDFTDGCCELEVRDRVLQIFIVFHTLVVADKVDPQVAHREFLKIEEYRRAISPDLLATALAVETRP